MRNLLMTGILGLGLLLGAQPGVRHRVAHSARNFEQSFRDLKVSEKSLSPLERFVFSLLLASTNPSQGR